MFSRNVPSWTMFNVCIGLGLVKTHEEGTILRHECKSLPKNCKADLADIHSVDDDAPSLQLHHTAPNQPMI
jgi:hypothetical protein